MFLRSGGGRLNREGGLRIFSLGREQFIREGAYHNQRGSSEREHTIIGLKGVFYDISITFWTITNQLVTCITGNAAKRKPAAQSSTCCGGVPSRGNDGNANPSWGGRSCTATQRQGRPWWRVDLQRVTTVGKVKITNRNDCCWNRLRNVQVRVGNSAAGPDRNFL